jgi:RNA polymerase sigma-70 factor (ECF subfamily)
MSGPSLNRVVHFLHRAAAPAVGEEDGELLRRFVGAGEEAAFAGLVRRHGAMVLGVCRRLLNDAHEAEDAFQATFLVLARRAAAVRKQDSVASWLYGVAYRVSRRARAAAAQRARAVGAAVEPVSTADPTAEAAWRELRPVIDEELGRLPEKYRTPLVLCYLEGKTNEEAAQLLGWTKGTVSGRLARARDLLRPRLARRGLGLAAGAVAVLLAQHGAAPASAALVETTVKAVLAGSLSAPAAALAQGVIRAMFRKKIMTVAALVVGIGLVGGGVDLLKQYTSGGEEPPAKGKPGVVFTLPEEPKKAPKMEADDLPKLQGTWRAVALEHNGTKLSAEAVKKFRVVIRDNTVTFDPDGNKREARFALGTNSKPKAILLKAGPKAPMVRGIYALDEERLKLCFDNDTGKTTPTEFATTPDSGLTLITLERAAAVAKPPAEKQYAFEMKEKPWKEVIEWFADVSGLRYTGKETPPGAFTFTPPKGKQYTIPEIVDILNEALLADKKTPYLLIRRPKQPPAGTFALVPADQKLPPLSLRIDLEDLDKFGRTEIVWVEVRLKGGHSAEVIAVLRKHHSPWGSATTTGGGRLLMLTDTTAAVREIIKALRAADELAEGAAPRTFKGSDSPVRGVAFSPDGKVVWTCAEDGRVLAWDVATGKERIRAMTDRTKCLALAISPEGKRVLIGGTTEATEGKGNAPRKVDVGVMALYTKQFKGAGIWREVSDAGVRAVAFSPDGKRVAAACDNGLVLVRDAEAGRIVKTLGRKEYGRITTVAFSPDGKLLAAGSAHKKVRFWDMATGRETPVELNPPGAVTTVQFSPDGRTLVTAGDGKVYLWDVAAGKELFRFEAGKEGARAAAFSPDGKLIVAAGPEGRLRGWQATTGEGPWSVEANKKGVNAVAFSPDGELLATAGADGEVRLWPVAKSR